MARNLRVVTQDAIITNDTIVGNMAIRHDEAIVSNLRGPPVLTTPVNGHKFADGCIIPDLHCCMFSFVFQILWNGCDHGAGKDAAVLTDPGSLHNCNIAPDPGTFADLHILVNNTEGINLNVGGKISIRVNVRVGMNHLIFLSN
jgi:hypothetical protein